MVAAGAPSSDPRGQAFRRLPGLHRPHCGIGSCGRCWQTPEADMLDLPGAMSPTSNRLTRTQPPLASDPRASSVPGHPMRRHARRGQSGGSQQAGQRGLAPHGDMAGLQEHVADLHARVQGEEAWCTAVWMSNAGQESERHLMCCVTRGMLTCQRKLASPRRPNILPTS